jgi:hypothetical protein
MAYRYQPSHCMTSFAVSHARVTYRLEFYMRRAHYVVVLTAIASMVGCAGYTGSPPAPFGSATQGSWMSRKASAAPNLLYVSNATDVSVYTYENAQDIKLIGTLTGFTSPKGLCSDRAGNVFIADYSARKVYEYTHGGTKPVRVLSRATGYPYACSVDPNTNDLAISFEHPNGKFQDFADVLIYPDEGGSPKRFTTYSGLYLAYFLAYDNKDDLYLDASPCVPYCYDSGGPPALFVLPRGGALFQEIPLSGVTLYEPTGVVWVNPSLLVGDNNFQGSNSSGAYKIVVTPSSGSLKGNIPFAQTQDTYGFTVRAGQVIVPDQGGDIFRIYSLSNGTFQSSFTQGLSSPFAAVISQKT